MSERPPRRWIGIFRPAVQEEVDDELAYHIEARVQDYIARGMDPESARVAASERLGDLKGVRRECTGLLAAERRDESRRELVRFSWLDFKLGFRMLRRYPGLTIVGGLAMAFAIAVGAGAFEAVKQMVDPRLPLPDGDRLVVIRNQDVETGEIQSQASYDLAQWREQLSAVEQFGAYRTVARNLIGPDGSTEPVHAAEMSASGFLLAGVPPLLGRTLVDGDEAESAPLVIVLGHELWRTRFGSDRDVVGSTIRVGRESATVVGVMPAGFAFPVAHRAWLPLRLSAVDNAPGSGPPIEVFGRLAEGVSLEEAQTELTALGARAAAALPATHEHLRPTMMKFAASVVTLDLPPAYRPLFYAVNLIFVMLLVLVCANVALLMFARAAARESEIIVRNALGASRGRIITQLFTEALVLGAAAAIVGLAVARFMLGTLLSVYDIESNGLVPFWFEASLAPTTVLYAVALTVAGAAIAGILPALKMTGRHVEARLRQLAAGGGGPRFGRVWTIVIVTQVAVTVAFPATAYLARNHVMGIRTADVGFPAEQYLSLRLEMERTADAGGSPPAAEQGSPLAAAYDELERRLEDEPGVLGVTFANRLPRTHHPALPVEVDDAIQPDIAPVSLPRASPVAADPAFFDVLGARIDAGRGLRATDIDSEAPVVVVNRSFAERMLGGRNAVGRRVRYIERSRERTPGPWHEIVGVVPDLGMFDDVAKGAGVYHAVSPDQSAVLNVIVHVRGDPYAFAPRLRALATAVDPELQLHDVLPLDEVGASLWTEFTFIYRLLFVLSSIALLLSLAGIYAVTSFTVSRRTREIGVRIALGAEPARLVATIFRRPLMHIGTGIALGAAMVAALAYGTLGSGLWPTGVATLMIYAAVMMGVCLLACIVPTRRVLAVQPNEALRADG